MKKSSLYIPLIIAAATSMAACSVKTPSGGTPPLPASEFGEMSAYNDWADSYGYADGLLTQEGMNGVYMDRFMTTPGTPGYDSGSIVIGDSRCCQLGIYQQRAGRSDFAAFGVWGGRYWTGRAPAIMTDTLVSAVESCFRRQIEVHGSSIIYFFATVNDYDSTGRNNAESIAQAVKAAEKLAVMEFEFKGRLHRPEVIVIGFDGCMEGVTAYGTGPNGFNGYIAEYNSALRAAVEKSGVLKEYADHFTTVPEIAGTTGFISDALHYDDLTLNKICEHIRKSAAH